jgi:exodeoxyribonuclease III
MKMLLITWNVNSLRVRLPRLLELLEKHRPDVVCLQETKAEPAAFPHAELRESGYAAVDHSAGRWAGVAILAREPLELEAPRSGLEGERQAGEARWLEATVDGVRVVSVYVPNGRAIGTETFSDKLAFFEALAERAAELASGPAVIAGDMNVCRTDLDVYDPAAFAESTHVTPEERGRFEAILGTGFTDAFRELHPGEQGFTWWDYRAGHFHRRLGLRLDYALLSKDLRPRLESCGIDRDFRKGQKPSDHAPLLVELA